MQTVKLSSPILHTLRAHAPTVGLINGMEVALSFGSEPQETLRKKTLGICDVSCFRRFGIKGVNIAQWMEAKGISCPSTANSWIVHRDSTLVLRLGNSECLIEDQMEAQTCESLYACQNFDPYGVVPVHRNDTALILSGNNIQMLLAELCTLDLREQSLSENTVVMTQLAGISVTLIRQMLNGEPVYRLWCDGTYGAYLWHTLTEIAEEYGGGAVGLWAFYKRNQ